MKDKIKIVANTPVEEGVMVRRCGGPWLGISDDVMHDHNISHIIERCRYKERDERNKVTYFILDRLFGPHIVSPFFR